MSGQGGHHERVGRVGIMSEQAGWATRTGGQGRRTVGQHVNGWAGWADGMQIRESERRVYGCWQGAGHSTVTSLDSKRMEARG